MSKITFENRIPDAEFIDACNKAISIEELSRYFQVSTSTITRRIEKLGCRRPNGKKVENIYGYSDKEFITICKNSISMAQAASEMSIPFTSFVRRAKKLGCYHTNQPGIGIKKNFPRKYEVNDFYFHNWTPQMAYWVGLIVADGHILTDCDNRVRLSLKDSDKCVLERLKDDLNFTGPIIPAKNINKETGKVYYHNVITINSKQIIDDLYNIGVYKKKTYKSINYINNIPNEYVPYYIIGLFDGDGSIESRAGTISFTGDRVNCLSVYYYMGFTDEELYIRDFEEYSIIALRYRENFFKFYCFYMKYMNEIITMERKKERILYFYNLYSQRHPEWL